MHSAEHVSILTGGKVEAHGPTAQDLVIYYSLRGISAEIVTFASGDPATALFATSERIGASLLVTGAYSHSHQSEMLFGGNTERIVDDMQMPVLMAH